MKANSPPGIAIVLFTLIVLSGCIPIPLVHSGPFIPPDMPQDLQDKIVSEGWTRQQVVAALGGPDATNDEARAIGYWRCDPYGIYVFPTQVVEQWETCFLYGFWFDMDGHAFKEGVSVGRSNYVSEHKRDLACPVHVWLSTPGGGCPKE